MKRNWMKLSMIPALALSLVMWGCENLSEQQLTGPSESSEVLLTHTFSNGYTVARETDLTVGTVYATIGEAGGAISVGQHVLFVPAGAVDAPTVFTMTLAGDQVKASLSATRLLPNDVGSAGFAKPVKLTLFYGNATNVPADKPLQIVWLKADGSVVPQNSYVDFNKRAVSADLGHFSDYAIAWPD